MRRRTTILVLLMLLTLLQPLSGAVAMAVEPQAAGNVEYNRIVTTYPIMNAAGINDPGFLTKFIGADNNSVFNVAPAFTRNYANGSAEKPNNLSFDTTFRHQDDSNTYNVEYQYQMEEALSPAIKKGDLQVALMANLTNDNHWNAIRHIDKKTAYPEAWISTYSKYLIEHSTKQYNSDTTKTLGKYSFVPIGTDPYGLHLYFGAMGHVCTCGSSKVSNVSIILADTVGPRVTSVVASSDRSDGSLNLRPGEMIYFTLQFDEPIRFADDTAMSLANAPKLKLELRGITDNVVKNVAAEANLVSLDGDTLTFAYQVPATYTLPEGNVNTNFYISASAPYSEQTSWVSDSDVYNLKLFGKSGASGNYLNHSSKTSSLIVDMAGNPLDIARSTRALKAAAYLDGIVPTVTAIDIAGRAEASGEASVGDVYARIGEPLGFFVQFSEPVQYVRQTTGEAVPFDSGYLSDGRLLPGAQNMMFVGSDTIELLAELNIMEGSQPVKAAAQYVTNVRLKDGRSASRVYFRTSSSVNHDMSALVYEGGAEMPVGINRIYLQDSSAVKYYLADASGNPYASETIYIDAPDGQRLLPKQQQWLDLGKPQAATNLTAEGGKYRPMTYGGEQDATAFCFPVLISDPPAAGTAQASGSNGAIGYFMWRDEQELPPPYVDKYPFEYAVTGSSEQPDGSAYRPAMTYDKYPFTQIDSGNFIHIRFVEGVDYNFSTSQLVVYPVDHANNQGTGTSFTLDFTVDRRPPIIEQRSSSTYYYSSGEIRASIRFRDVSSMNSLEYQWTPIGATPTEWLSVTSYSTGGTSSYRYYDFSLKLSGLPTGVKHQYTLHVRGTDAAGNSSTAIFDHQLDLELPAYGLEFATDPKQPNGSHSLLLSPASGDKAADVVWVLVKQPPENQQHPNEVWYWRRVVNMTSISGPVDLLAINAADWHPCDVSVWDLDRVNENGLTVWRPGKSYSDRSLSDEAKAAFINYMNQYRPLEVTIIARQDWEYYVRDFIFFDEIYSTNTYTFNYASDYLIGDSGTINSIIITPPSNVSSGSLGKENVLSTSPDELKMLRSLDGAGFGVSLANARYGAYGLQDIDFESDDTVFALYETGEGASEFPVFSSKLVAKAYQEIAIPAGAVTEAGAYKVVVSVKARGSGHIDRKEYANILVDRRELVTYGVSRVTTTQTLGDLGDMTLSTDYAVAENGHPGTICASGLPHAEQYVRFSAEVNSLSIGGEPHFATYVKVFNETASAVLGEEAASPWIYLPQERQYRTVVLTEANRAQVLLDLASSDVNKAAILPILPGQNVIKYQFALPGGYQTPEQTLLMHAATEAPMISMQLSPVLGNGLTTSTDIVATIGLLQSPVVDTDTLQLGMLGDAGMSEAFASSRKITLSKNGDYCFYVLDKFHNVGYQQVTVDYIDREGPVLNVTDYSGVGGTDFQFLVQLGDDLGTDGCQLFVQFDNDYCNLLGVQPGTAFAVPLEHSWQAASVSNSGLYVATSIDDVSLGKKVIRFSGVFKYDDNADAPATAGRTITLYAVDRAGNKSDEWMKTVDVANQPTIYVKGELASSGFAATFNRPVLLSTPHESTAQPVYSVTKQQLPFYSNGVYQLDCVDIFGYRHTGNITVNQYAALYAHSVTISETVPTNQDVQIVLNAAFNLDVALELPESIAGGEISPVLDADGKAVGALITMHSNGSFSYKIQPKNSAYPTQTRSLFVQNIDKTSPQVTLEWVYTADIIDGKTAGDIIVSLQGDEKLQGLDGTSTTHTFTVSDQEPFVFHYADLAGNDGYVTATSVVEIVDKELVPSDTTPPSYEIEVYRTESGISSKLAGYTQSAYEALTESERADAFPLFSGALQLRFTAYDENQVTISLLDVPLQGVALSGWTVSVTDNGNFTVVLTDAKGNQTLVPISITQADTTPPVGTITYVRVSPYVIRGYLEMSDEGGGPVTLKNTSGAQIENINAVDRYYHEFRDNESFTFVFADAAGNIGTTVAVVSSLDMSPPSGTISQWIPYFIDQNGIAHLNQLSDRPTNSDVSVFLQFNKPIRTLTPQMTSGQLQDISLSHTEDSATVVFRQNASLEIEFQALNGRSSRLALEVDIIDKQPPVITASRTAANLKSVTYSFIADESVFFVDGGDVSQAATSFSKVFELNGDYDLKFTDLAGNSTITRVTVTGIDRTPPTLTINGLPGSGAPMTNQTVSFTASLDEPGTIAFRGVLYSVAAGQVQQFKVDHNGSYELVATDRAGLTTRYTVAINCIDKTPPQILYAGGELLVRQGADLAAVEQMLREQVQIYDNADPEPDFWVDYLYEEDLTTPGKLLAGLVAKDEAGNEQSISVRVRVYGHDELLVRVNGLLAPPGETSFVSAKASRVVTVTMENVPTGSGGEEPYRIYWKRGICTDAQMKNATLLTGDSFTAQQNGFYTIYVVTQSKASLLVHLYVQG